MSAEATGFDVFRVVGADGRVALERTLEKATAVDRWTQGFFFRGTFGSRRVAGGRASLAPGKGLGGAQPTAPQ